MSLSFTPTRRVALIGHTGTGKSALLPSDEGTMADRDHPTTRMQYVSAGFMVSKCPSDPLNGDTSYVQMIVWEYGDGGGTRNDNIVNLIAGKSNHAYDVVVFVFDATDRASYADLWKRWVPLRGVLSASANRLPFVVFAETHCDKIGPSRATRHRRAVEIDLYMQFGAGFLYFQLDATNGKARERMWRQIAVQLRWQPPRVRPHIRATLVQNNSTLTERIATYFHKLYRKLCSSSRRDYNAYGFDDDEDDDSDFELVNSEGFIEIY